MDALADLLRHNPASWVDLGVVLTPPAPSLQPGGVLAARHVVVQLVPSSRVVEARVANVGQGAGKGAFVPLQKGDEVVVLFPGGDPHRAVVLGGLGNGKAPNPPENTGLGMLLMHPGGVKLLSASGQPPHGIVHGQLLVELQALMTALQVFMTASSTATTAPQIATAAAVFVADPNVTTFLANLGASVSSGTAPGIGGPPFATALHKISP